MMKLFLVFFLTISTAAASTPVRVPELADRFEKLASNSGSEPIEEAKTSDEAKGELIKKQTFLC